MEMHRLSPHTTVKRALALTLANAPVILRREKIPVWAASGRVAAASVTSRIAVPPFHSSHVDGYALRSSDATGARASSPVTLVEVGQVHAGEHFPRLLRRGECVAVATGAEVPRGADAVQMFEEVTRREGTITLGSPVSRGQFVDGCGRDIREGELVAAKGEVITPAIIGTLGISGHANMPVYEKPRVAILSNGNELAEAGSPLPTACVYESNTAVLAAVVERAGGLPTRVPPVPDDERLLESAVRKALEEADMVVVSGGSSVGERDLVGRVFPRVGKVLFHGIRVRPGMPTIAASSGRKILLGMPGHPASCLINALWLLMPAVRKMCSLPVEGSELVSVTMEVDVPLHGHGFSTVVPLRIRGGRARPTFHGSHFTTSLRHANGLAILPQSKERLRKGERIHAHRLPFETGG